MKSFACEAEAGDADMPQADAAAAEMGPQTSTFSAAKASIRGHAVMQSDFSRSKWPGSDDPGAEG